MYILMDTESYSIKQDLNIDFVKPIQTVYRFLKEKESLEILNDPLWSIAITSISDSVNDNLEERNGGEQGRKSSRILAIEIEKKKNAILELLNKYESGKVSWFFFVSFFLS
jgi:hypothetical protein